MFFILRHRDDIRLFTNSKEDEEKIMKILSITLANHNFTLNQHKTLLYEDILKDGIKKTEKHYLINNSCDKK